MPPPVIILPPEPYFCGGQGGQELVRPVVSDRGQVSAVLGPTLLPGFSPGQALCKLLVTFTSRLKFSPSAVTTLIKSRNIHCTHKFMHVLFVLYVVPTSIDLAWSPASYSLSLRQQLHPLSWTVSASMSWDRCVAGPSSGPSPFCTSRTQLAPALWVLTPLTPSSIYRARAYGKISF